MTAVLDMWQHLMPEEWVGGSWERECTMHACFSQCITLWNRCVKKRASCFN